MPPRPSQWRLYAKMFAGGSLLCIGGPALVWYVTPSEEALFLRYNPELQKRSLENRVEKQQEFDEFVGRLKEYSKSDRTIWEAAAKDKKRGMEEREREQERLVREVREKQERMRGEIKGDS